jgi:hypothetical protein
VDAGPGAVNPASGIAEVITDSPRDRFNPNAMFGIPSSPFDHVPIAAFQDARVVRIANLFSGECEPVEARDAYHAAQNEAV